MIEDLKYDLSRAQNDPEIGPLRQIFNKPLKAAQVDMPTKTDVKPIDFFYRKLPMTVILTYFGVQSGHKIGPLRPIFYTHLKVLSMSM